MTEIRTAAQSLGNVRRFATKKRRWVRERPPASPCSLTIRLHRERYSPSTQHSLNRRFGGLTPSKASGWSDPTATSALRRSTMPSMRLINISRTSRKWLSRNYDNQLDFAASASLGFEQDYSHVIGEKSPSHSLNAQVHGRDAKPWIANRFERLCRLPIIQRPRPLLSAFQGCWRVRSSSTHFFSFLAVLQQLVSERPVFPAKLPVDKCPT